MCTFPFLLPLSPFIHAFLLCADALFPCALVLATLLQCAAGAPIDAPTDSPAGQPSGEEGETGSPNDTLAEALVTVLGATKRHKKEVGT